MFKTCVEVVRGKRPRTSFENLRRDVVEFGFELLKQRFDLFQHPPPRKTRTSTSNIHDLAGAFKPT